MSRNAAPAGKAVGGRSVMPRAGFAAQSRGRLRGVTGADLNRPMEAVRELRRAIEELRFVALRIVPWLCVKPRVSRSWC